MLSQKQNKGSTFWAQYLMTQYLLLRASILDSLKSQSA